MSAVPQIFDHSLRRQRLRRALAGTPATFLLDRAAEDLGDRLATIKRNFVDVLDFGTPLAAGTAAVARHAPEAAIQSIAAEADLEGPALTQGRHDLIVSLLALQTLNDLPGVLAQVRRALRPDGLFLAALIGGASLQELRSVLIEAESETKGGAAPRVAPFADVRSLGQLLQRAGFALPVADSELLTVRYPDPLALLHDLRAMGATNMLTLGARRPLGRETLARALDLYRARFADADGRVRATFEIVWLSGWAPHESQQKPLKPGSAEMRLADALAAVKQRKTGGGEEEI